MHVSSPGFCPASHPRGFLIPTNKKGRRDLAFAVPVLPGLPKSLKFRFRFHSCRDLDPEFDAGTAMYSPCPRIELAGDAVDAWPLVRPFVSEQIL